MDTITILAVGLLYFGFGTLFLHELGHWLVLKAWKIPHRFYFNKWLLIGFETDAVDSYDAIQVCLFGAIPPLLILVYPILIGDAFLIYSGLLMYIFQTLWTVLETWHCVNVARAQEKVENLATKPEATTPMKSGRTLMKPNVKAKIFIVVGVFFLVASSLFMGAQNVIPLGNSPIALLWVGGWMLLSFGFGAHAMYILLTEGAKSSTTGDNDGKNTKK